MATKEAVWLCRLLNNIGFPQQGPTPLLGDNQSAIRLVKNPEYHKRTKHIDIQYHFVREKFENGDIDISYISTEQQLADIMTKALPHDRFECLRRSLHMATLTEVQETTDKFVSQVSTS